MSENSGVKICEASAAGYDGLWGVYCALPKGHDGPHNDGHIEWRFVDIEDPWKAPTSSTSTSQ